MNVTRAEIEQAIVNTVTYVDAFDYPLTTAEIHRYLVGLHLPHSRVTDLLHASNLVPWRLNRVGDYYMLPGRETISQLRDERRAISERLWPRAVQYGLLMARMPFVRMIAVTGSLAVNNVGPKEDIDFFIITADDHLWVCRAFIILIVRMAARHGLELCPNFFLAESAIYLTEQNIFTAHEVTQMVPIYGLAQYKRLRSANPWVHKILPNALGAPSLPLEAQRVIRQTRNAPYRRMLEAALRTPPGRALDRWEMARKIERFRQIDSTWEEAEFSAQQCKGHFNHHQQAAIQAYERKVNRYEPQVDPVEVDIQLRAST